MVGINKGIFVSYRRDETIAYSGWLASVLVTHFGKQNVFRDIGSIEPGMDFVEAIERAIEKCAVMLVVIGEKWATVLKEHERTGQEDFTRLEIASALKRDNVRVIPVLVQGASMPCAEELSDDLAALRRRQAIELHDTNWERDVAHLIAVLEKIVGSAEEGTRGASAQEALRPTEQGQIAERFTRAIEQLGATDDKGGMKLEIRLGGIYALERIDKESPERAYHGTVMEVLTAYVRENSRWEPEFFRANTASNEEAEQDTGVEQNVKPTLQRLPTDILAILDVLKRREEERVPKEHRVHLDLRQSYLKVANLQRAILYSTNLQEANLRRADLLGAKLQGANLQGAHLQGAELQEANLRGAIVTDEQLATCKRLVDATMPNGQKYEDWIQDKEGSGKGVENE